MTDVADVQLVKALVGYAVGSNGGIYKTTNGGTTWVSQNSRRDKSYAFTAVSFTAPDSGLAVGAQRARWRTSNGGSTWTIDDDYSGSPYNDVLRYGPGRHLLATPKGFEAYGPPNSSGYYGSATEPDETYHYPVYGLASAGPRGALVGVGERTLIRYHPEFSKSDYTPWVSVHRPDGTSFEGTYYAADFADASTCYAVGAHGLIHRFHYQ